jgi:YgiT-type zinc finger domain-containing protein
MVAGFPAKATTMKCVICKTGETRPGTATVTLEQSGVTLVCRNVPADICDTCGEEYISEEVSAQLAAGLTDAAASGRVLELRDYKAA